MSLMDYRIHATIEDEPESNQPIAITTTTALPFRSPIVRDDKQYLTVLDSWNEYETTFKRQDDVMEQQIGGVIPIQMHGGFKIILKCIEIPDKTDSGLYIPDAAKGDYLTSPIGTYGVVIGIGPEAYKDSERHPYGPRCKIGDIVDFSAYEKEKRIYGGFPCHIIHDDRINYPVTDVNLVVPLLQPTIRKVQAELATLNLLGPKEE